MAKTLKEFKAEFAAIQKESLSTRDEISELDNNLGAILDQMTEGFKVLGARIAELRTAGLQADDLAPYLADREVTVMVQELQRKRESGKTAGTRAAAIYKGSIKGLRQRMKTLRDSLATEITVRQKKTNQAALGLNQSVKEMLPLQGEINVYIKTPVWSDIVNQSEPIPAKQFTNVYEDLLTEQLNKTAKEVRKDEKLAAAKQRLNDKVLNAQIKKVAGFALTIRKQLKLASTAQKLKDVAGLARLKTNGGKAMEQIELLVAPYEKLLANAKIKAMIISSPDASMINKGTSQLFALKSKAQEELDELNGRTLTQ